MMKEDFPKVYIVILNYNGWADTIECLESVLRNDYPNYQVIVVDNNSPNNSMEYIKKWAEGKLDVWVRSDHPLRHLSFPPVKKPIPYVYYGREEAEKGGNSDWENGLIAKSLNSKKGIDQVFSQSTNQPFNKSTIQPINYSTKYPLVLIQTGENLGYAGGNNVGIRYALAKNDFGYIWILNNDTVVEKNALSELVWKFEEYRRKKKKVGITGSKLLYYDRPEIIQGVGGIYNKWLAVNKHLGIFEKDRGQYDSEEVSKRMDYVIGASMLVSRDFIEEVGLMCEDYFLYFEEVDWAMRGKRKGYQLGYCWKSRIYHKEGRSIGTSSKGKERSEISDFYLTKNKILFTKKFFPKCILSVCLGLGVVAFNRIRRRQFNRIKLIKVALEELWKN